MRGPFASLYGRVAALFLVLLLVFSLAALVIGLRFARDFAWETDQALHRTLAADLVGAFQPALAEGLDGEAVTGLMGQMMVYNPRIEIYLLSATGRIVFAGDKPVVRQRVSLEPIRRFLADPDGPRRPILADDPLHADRQKPFSVAPIDVGGTPGYLFLILGGEQYETIAGMVEDSYLVQTLLVVAAAGFAVIALAGLILFFLLTRRVRAMSRAVHAFERGDYASRVRARAGDEIGELGRAFDDMADRVVAHMDQIEEQDRLRRELVANVSHDLRSPLSSVQGYLETVLMKDRVLTRDQRRKYLRIIHHNVKRLARLVEDLFELSRLEAHQLTLELEPFPLSELVQDVLLKFAPQAKQRRIALKGRMRRDLPFVVGDLGLIERALGNLVDNAIRYTPEGGTVTVGIDPLPDALRVSVTDTGRGIAPDDLPHVFDRNYRAGGIRQPADGAGIGLAIVKSIVEHHQSRIEVESAVGEGTRFTFALPLAEAEAAPEVPPPMAAGSSE